MLRINLFYRKPRSFATTRRHSFFATDGCPPCVRLSPSAVCLLRIAFRELAFSKSDFRDRANFRFFPCFSSVACAASCTKSPYSRRTLRFLAQGRHIPDVLSVFFAFSHVLQPFSPDPTARSYFTPHAPFRSVKICKRFACESLWYALSKNDFSSDSEAFPTRIFKSLLSHFEFTVYRRFFKKENSNGKSRCFERTLCCKIIIVERLRNDGEIVRTKPEKRTTCHSYSKHSLLRARRSYPPVRPPSFRKPYTFFLFSVLFLRFLCFLCVPMCFSVSAPSFLSPVPTIGLKVGVPERRSTEVSMVFRFSVAVFFTLRPAAMPHLQKSVRATPRATSAETIFSPSRIQNRHSKAKSLCNIIIVYMSRDGSYIVSIFYEL